MQGVPYARIPPKYEDVNVLICHVQDTPLARHVHYRLHHVLKGVAEDPPPPAPAPGLHSQEAELLEHDLQAFRETVTLLRQVLPAQVCLR